MNTKFTKDGHKYAIISELNDSQYIVQEIYISNGEEISAGPNIAIKKSLLFDSPLETWKETYFANMESEWEKKRITMEKEIEEQEKKLKKEQNKMYIHTKTLQNMCSDLDRNGRLAFIRLLDFLSGNIKWVIHRRYDKPVLIPFDELDLYDRNCWGNAEGMKLITLYGNTKGDMLYNIDKYGDGSCGSQETYVFCYEEDALLEMKRIIKEYSISHVIIEVAEKYGVELDKEKLREFYKKERESCEKQIREHEEKIEKLTETLNKIPSNKND